MLKECSNTRIYNVSTTGQKKSRQMHFLMRLAPPYPTLHITTVSIDVIPQYNAQASDRRLECCTKECVPISSSAEPLPGSHIIILYSSRPASLSPQSFRLADVLGEFLDERQVDVDLAGKPLHVQLTSGAHLGHGLRHTLCHHTQGDCHQQHPWGSVTTSVTRSVSRGIRRELC